MIALAVLSIGAIVWRIWTRELSRDEAMLASVVVVSILMVVMQSYVADHRLPEKRYWLQTTLLLYPWGIWGIGQLWRWRRMPLGLVLVTVFSVFAIIDLSMLVKVHVTGSRRNAAVAACDWAVAKIREDWKGPARDPEFTYAESNYHPPYRPCVDAHTRRVPYLVGGRRWSKSVNREMGERYDYWVQELNGPGGTPPTSSCLLMGTFECGKYRFQLWKRRGSDALPDEKRREVRK